MGAARDGEARLIGVKLDPSAGVQSGPDVEHERRVAIFDLIEENYFLPACGAGGPYQLSLSRSEGRLIFDIEDEDETPQGSISLPLSTLRQTLRDYGEICKSYHDAIRTAPRSRIEAIDIGRRALHNEGAETIREVLADSIEMDEVTARRLFTLIFALHVRL